MDTPKSLLTVLLRKLDQQEGVSRPAVEATSTPSPTPVATPAPKPKPVPATPPKPKPKQTSTPTATPKPAPAPTPAPAPAAVRGTYYVQVGAFSNQANAKTAGAKTGGTVVQAGNLWRVRMGPYASEAQAKAALAKARAAGYKDARIQSAK
jgi:rare lipoprotein A